jgi:hypothetical protein
LSAIWDEKRKVRDGEQEEVAAWAIKSSVTLSSPQESSILGCVCALLLVRHGECAFCAGVENRRKRQKTGIIPDGGIRGTRNQGKSIPEIL